MQPTFSIGDALMFGWKKTIENVWFLGLLTLVFMVISFFLDKVHGDQSTVIVFRFLNILVSYFAAFTFVKIALRVSKGEKPSTRDIFHVDWPLFGLYLIASIISTIITVVGFILIVLPGIYICIRLSLFSFALIDGHMRPLQSLRKSLDLTRYSFWKLLLFILVLALINIVGSIPFGLGILITLPMSLLATGYVYEKLTATHTSTPAVPIVEPAA